MEMRVGQLMVCLTLLFTGRSSAQEIQLQRQAYLVSEDVSMKNLVLRVCVEGANLDDQTYNVTIKTEDADLNTATDGVDYIGIDRELSLSGPGMDTKCTCVQVLEDQENEVEERIGLRISGSPIITRDSVNAIIRDNDGISFRFIGNSPRVEDNTVTFELAFEPNVVSANCSVLDFSDTVDCSDGLAHFSLPADLRRSFRPVITTMGQQGEIETRQDPRRLFRTSADHGRCSVHLINDGFSHDPLTGNTTLEWVWSGAGAEGRTYCILNNVRQGRCFSPYVIPGLANGLHRLRILVRRGRCPGGRSSRTIPFRVPTF